MKVLVRVIVLISTTLLVSAAWALTAQEQKAIDVDIARVFQQASAEHEVIIDAPGPQQQQAEVPRPLTGKAPWSLGWYPTALSRSEAMEGLVERVTKANRQGNIERTHAYCRTGATYLTDQHPAMRAVACEFLAHFPRQTVDLGTLPHLAALGDDAATAFTTQQMENFTPTEMSVADVAHIAVMNVTGVRFPRTADFGVWWGVYSKTYRTSLWYWAAASCEKEIDQELLSQKPPLQTLKIAVLIATDPARQYEAELPWRRNNQPLPEISVSSQYIAGPQTINLAHFVTDNKLQSELLNVLAGKTQWEELTRNPSAVYGVVYHLIPLFREVLKTDDAQRLIAIAADPHSLVSTSTESQIELILLATGLDNDHAEDILLSQIKRLPNQYRLYDALLERTGLKHLDLIQQVFQDQPDLRAELVNQVGKTHDPGARALLRDWYAKQDFTYQLEALDHPTDADETRMAMLSAFANAAKSLNHDTAVVSEELLDRCRMMWGKVDIDEAKTHNQGIPAARAEATRRLRDFFNANP